MTPKDRIEKIFDQVTLPLDSLDIEVLKLSMEEALREAVADAEKTLLGPDFSKPPCHGFWL